MIEQKLPKEKESILAMFEGTRTQNFLKELPCWDDVSLNPSKKEVCIKTGDKIISLSVPKQLSKPV